MTIYRRIYEQHKGPIPTDEEGRTFDIHHIDGNRENNDPSNLVALSLQEHYNVHLEQGDYDACFILSARLKIPPETKSLLTKLARLKEVSEGTHHWTKESHRQWARQHSIKQWIEGTNPFFDAVKNRNDRLKEVAEGIHNTQNPAINAIRSKKQKDKVEKGIHHLLGGEIQKRGASKRLKENRHPSQIMIECKHCAKTVDSMNYGRWHGDKCKMKR